MQAPTVARQGRFAERVPDPEIQHPATRIIKVTACAICGSDLHIYDGVIPTMESGDVWGTRPWAKWWKSDAASAP